MSKQVKNASYPLKIQAIRSKGQNLRFYVYLPMPLAAALGRFTLADDGVHKVDFVAGAPPSTTDFSRRD